MWIDCNPFLLKNKCLLVTTCMEGSFIGPFILLLVSASRLARQFSRRWLSVQPHTVSVTKYVMTPWVLLPLAPEELLVLFLGLCKAQPGTLHRVTYPTQLKQVRVLLFLLGGGALFLYPAILGAPLINLAMGLQSKIMFSVLFIHPCQK